MLSRFRTRRRGGQSGGSIPGGAVLWLDAASPQYVTLRAAEFVTAWAGRTGNTALQATEARQPTYVAGSINGLAAVEFNVASSHFMTVAAATPINNLWLGGGSLFAVLKPDVSPGTDHFIGKNASLWRVATTVQPPGYVEFVAPFSTTAGKWRSDNGDVVDGTPMLIEVHYDSASAANNPVLRVNGALTAVNEIDAPVGTSVSDSGEPLVIGGNASTAGDWDGFMGEVVLFGTTLSAPAQASMRAYLTAKWGL